MFTEFAWFLDGRTSILVQIIFAEFLATFSLFSYATYEMSNQINGL